MSEVRATRTIGRGWVTTPLMAAAVLAWLVWDPPGPRGVRAYADLPPEKRTGAPGENDCTSCHGSLNDGQGNVSIVGVPASYVPGETYTLGVVIAHVGKQCWGFELTCIRSDGAAAGTLTSTTPATAIQSGTVSGNVRSYVSHTTTFGFDGTFSGILDGAGWTFDWTAPAVGAGAVTFYAAGVTADGDNDPAGDPVYTSPPVPSVEGGTTSVTTTTWAAIKRAYR